ncbi:hypothetical protein [Paraburkholderia sp. BR10954]|uniref:hypothetical protein n=1 Tax=Paraburkholderia sp. BR10954 TaxID=3236995 RepID=UPI0034D2D5E5
MNHGTKRIQPLDAGRNTNEHRQNGAMGDDSREDAAQAAQNWAWSNAQGHYDWMDSHTPSASID